MNIKQTLVNTAILLSLAAPALAHDGWEGKSEYQKHFNARTIQTVSGKVVKIDHNHTPLRGMAPGYAAVIQPANGEAITVEIAPNWFTAFNKQKYDAAVGTQMTVTGSVVTLDGHKVLYATQTQQGNNKTSLRNNQGWPVWDTEVSDF